MKLQEFIEQVLDVVADPNSELVFEDHRGQELTPVLDIDDFQVGQDWTIVPLRPKE